MKSDSFSKKGITFLLLLIFFQQMGAGLFVHNLVHDRQDEPVPAEQKENGREINFACKCIDDFLMPFVADDQRPVLKKPGMAVSTYDDYVESAFLISLTISSLRGPPVFIV